MNLVELLFQRTKTLHEANKLLDLAVTESRKLTISEQVKFDALCARLKELDAAAEARTALRRMN